MSQGTWTPREIEDDAALTLVDEKIISTIKAFEAAGKDCYQSNAKLAQKCRCSTRTISRRVQELVKNRRITSEKFDGRKRILRSCRATMSQQPRQDGETAETQCQENSISNNTLSYSDDICDQQARTDQEGLQRPFSVDEVREYCQQNGYKVDPAVFFDYYEGTGWQTGPNAVHDWRAVLRTWHHRGERMAKKSSSKANKDTHQSPRPGEFGNSFDTDDFFGEALRRSLGDELVDQIRQGQDCT